MEKPVLIAFFSIIISVVALFRPELWAILGKIFNKIDLFPGARFEVGFSTFGPTFGIVGTLAATNNDQLVEDISVNLVRERDNSTHTFKWLAFRSTNVLLQGTEKLEAEVASAFYIKNRESKKLNIFFSDQVTLEEMKPYVLGLKASFQEYLKTNSTAYFALDYAKKLEVYNKFDEINRRLTLHAYSELTKRFYWTAGSYLAVVKIRTGRPRKLFQFTYKFHLSDEDVKSLSMNVVMMMYEACDLGSNYNFVSPVWLVSGSPNDEKQS